MIAHWCFVLLLCYGFIVQTNGQLFRTSGPFPPKTDPNLLVENRVRQNGYPFELHHVTTEDGYILGIHRIPNRSKKTIKNHRVVLIMHGLLGCSMDWLTASRNRSIAYLLADDGYDVWLGNSRGTTYSKNHTYLSIQSAQFWDFSWHELGIHDLPAIINYILYQTDQKQLFYIGLSQGTTQFWVLTSLKPEFNKKIKLMSALAPVAYTGHIEGLLKPLSFFANLLKGLYNFTGFFELFPNTELIKFITYNLCQRNSPLQPFCLLSLSITGGFSTEETDYVHVEDSLQFTPAGCSYKQLVHYAMGIQNPEHLLIAYKIANNADKYLEIWKIQRNVLNKNCIDGRGTNNGHFRPYDYGLLKNLKVYGQLIPPEYPVEKITAPVILYIGLNDILGAPNDVEILNRKLPNVLEKYTVKGLNHLDFVLALHIRDLVYNHLIEKMNSIP